MINPQGGFHLMAHNGSGGIILPYNYKDFSVFPTFRKVYPKIKALLEDEDNIVIGHAIQNDVKFLNLDAKRYSLPSFCFKYYDTQLIYMTSIKDFSHQYGLDTIVSQLGVEYTPHRAADDAFATMKIAETLSQGHDKSFLKLCIDLEITAGNIRDYEVKLPTSSLYTQYYNEHVKMKEQRARNRAKFNEHLVRKRIKDGPWKGYVFNFSRRLEDDVSRSILLVDIIYSKGGVYSQKLDGSNIYVADEDDESERTKRAKLKENVKYVTPAYITGGNDGTA